MLELLALRSTLFPYTTLFRSEVELEARLPRRELGLPLTAVVGVGQLRPLALGLVELVEDGVEGVPPAVHGVAGVARSEEHTSELQSHVNHVCRILLEKKKIAA